MTTDVSIPRRLPWKRVVVALIVWIVAGVIGTAGVVVATLGRSGASASGEGKKPYWAPDGRLWTFERFGIARDEYFVVGRDDDNGVGYSQWIVLHQTATADVYLKDAPRITRRIPVWLETPVPFDQGYASAHGWPLRWCLWRGGYFVLSAAAGDHLLPMRIDLFGNATGMMWPLPAPRQVLVAPLLANVLAWGALPAFMAWYLPAACREFRRRFITPAHCCPACNYDLRGLPASAGGAGGGGGAVCPECGEPRSQPHIGHCAEPVSPSRIMPAVDQPNSNIEGPATR